MRSKGLPQDATRAGSGKGFLRPRGGSVALEMVVHFDVVHVVLAHVVDDDDFVVGLCRFVRAVSGRCHGYTGLAEGMEEGTKKRTEEGAEDASCVLNDATKWMGRPILSFVIFAVVLVGVLVAVRVGSRVALIFPPRSINAVSVVLFLLVFYPLPVVTRLDRLPQVSKVIPFSQQGRSTKFQLLHQYLFPCWSLGCLVLRWTREVVVVAAHDHGLSGEKFDFGMEKVRCPFES